MNLEKEYKIPADIYRDGYREYQKKYVYPKNYVFMGIFLVLAANFVYGAVKAPDNMLAYLLIVVCLAMAFREWYNPRKMRSSFMETVKDMGEPVYKLMVTQKELIFSTMNSGNSETDEEDEELPELSRLQITDDLKILEYDRFFLAVYGKYVFYIIPKENFTEPEMAVLRQMHNA